MIKKNQHLFKYKNHWRFFLNPPINFLNSLTRQILNFRKFHLIHGASRLFYILHAKSIKSTMLIRHTTKKAAAERVKRKNEKKAHIQRDQGALINIKCVAASVHLYIFGCFQRQMERYTVYGIWRNIYMVIQMAHTKLSFFLCLDMYVQWGVFI